MSLSWDWRCRASNKCQCHNLAAIIQCQNICRAIWLSNMDQIVSFRSFIDILISMQSSKVMANICRPPGTMEGWRRRRCENMNQAKEKIIKLKYIKTRLFFFFRVLGLVFSSSSSSPFSLGQMGVEKKKKIGWHIQCNRRGWLLLCVWEVEHLSGPDCSSSS